jgi:NAD(P)-dependent dehydrogenase (short-subunit alcohol dehydrogenase family)
MSTARARGWTAAEIPDLSGRTAVVTGGGAGIGLETARVLAARGARVVLACRNAGQAARAADGIRAQHGRAQVAIVHLDLASLASVRAAAEELRATCPRLDLLVNNAAVMKVPYTRTEDGFELTLATNHLGHFALTGLVLDRLLATPGSRIVTVSSVAHADDVMNLDDLQSERRYAPDDAYSQSKLANLFFTYELDRRLRAAGVATIALAAHPGIVLTDLYRTHSRLALIPFSPRLRIINSRLVQSVQMGALPTLRAAADPAANGGDYYGPPGRGYTGHPVRVQSSARSHDTAEQARLWDASEQLTGVAYRIPARPAVS